MEEPLVDMKYEEARLTTFRGWPANAKVEAWKMAKAGLLYTGQQEEVRCTFCNCTISDWQYGDQVMSKHRQANPTCPFIQNQSDNVPLQQVNAVAGLARTHTDARAVLQSGTDMVDGGRQEEEDTDDVGIITSSRRRVVLDTMRSVSESDHAGGDHFMAGGEDTGYESGPGGGHMLGGGEVSAGPSGGSTEQDAATLNHMKSEANRLATFTNWSKPYIRPIDLAKAGFFYVNQRDNCRCAFCGQFVGEWEEGDVPMNEHKKLFPLCGFVRGQNVGNIPLAEGGQDVVGEVVGGEAGNAGRVSPGHDEVGIHQRMPASAPENQHQINTNLEEELGIISHHGPMHPQYTTPDARLRSFGEWPPGLKVQPKELVDAGFYYIGLSDQVKCFYCDGGLRNWHSDDDPWVEHARWFSKCAFVRLKKGEDFIRKCIESKPPDEPHEIQGRGGGREVTEDEIRIAMSEAIVRQVLSMGIDHSRVKMAIKKQLENYGYGFANPEHLINAAFSVQRQQERRVNHEHNNPSGAMLSGMRRPSAPSQQQQPRQRRSFDEVTMRRWEEESYMSTEDEDDPPPRSSTSSQQAAAGPSPLSTFRSLPPGVKLTSPARTSSGDEAQAGGSRPSTSGGEVTAAPAPSTSRSATGTSTGQRPGGSDDDVPMVMSPTAGTNSEAAGSSSSSHHVSTPSSAAKTAVNLENSSSCKSPDIQQQQPPSSEVLEQENARLREQRTCKVCMDSEVGVVFLPCGHLICCVNCAPSLKDCAVCRTKIQGTVRTFMS